MKKAVELIEEIKRSKKMGTKETFTKEYLDRCEKKGFDPYNIITKEALMSSSVSRRTYFKDSRRITVHKSSNRRASED